jgi:anti-sigma factor RsiW
MVASSSTWLVVGSQQPTMVADVLVSDHIRSLMAPEPVDVVSSDRHTVKPWFNGRIPISPRVVDLAKENFPLVGGRIDVVGQAPVSTLVYRHAKHLISLTAMPIDSRFELEKTPRAVNGYNVVHWVDNGVSYWAISDLQAKELEEFAQLFRTTQTEL